MQGNYFGMFMFDTSNGIEQYRKYAGKCNLQTGEAPNENTLYRIYSLTKLYTAVAALQLIEQKNYG